MANDPKKNYPLPKFHFQLEWGGTRVGFTAEDHQAMQSMYHFKIKVDPAFAWGVPELLDAANMLKTFDYIFYPRFPDLRRTLETRIRQLGGSDLEPVGPPGFHALRRWIGWRTARRMQNLAGWVGLNRATRAKR